MFDIGWMELMVIGVVALIVVGPRDLPEMFRQLGRITAKLRQMGRELAEVFARMLGPDDVTILCDPVYFGGTVDRSEGSERIVRLIREGGGHAEHVPLRKDCAARIAALARPGDRVVVMGARDDTLTVFARDLLARLA